MRREMIINTLQREECRIAITENNRLEEIYLERAAAENHVGNIYKGIITNVEPSIQAAFVDFGQGKNGFLHISDLHPEYFPNGEGNTENVGRKMPRRARPPIQKCLRRGQEVLVQVTKEGIGTKGPTLTTYLSIPGRFLVMMPGMRRLGVSRRIEDDGARERLRTTLAQLELPEGVGFIARTAAIDRPLDELQNDLLYLTRLWRAVEKRIKNDAAPAELYRESDLVIRTIRDVFTDDIDKILVDDEEVATRAREFLSIFSPKSESIVVTYREPEPIFHKFSIEAELERLHSRHVPLKSGGSLVIEQTEALVAIDVNSGKFRSEDDAETTAYKINFEAADEIARQLRLRDLGGVVVCDFIDMRLEKHRREIERRLIGNLKAHKERAKVLRTSAFGLIELTRQRQRASLTRSVYRDCPHCRGTGLVKTVESVTLDVMRIIQLAVTREHIRMVEVAVAPDVAYLLQNRKRALIHELETRHRRIVSIRPDPSFSQDQVEVTCTDARGRVVPYT
ncbi:MAG: Rne/Rng family ribonuclease [Phycisphaerales bacterium]|nr:Rne/Rng family ribonuclease [Phycisphaerales bacterium]